MEQLNQYLQTLMSNAGYELHLEPNKKPYFISASGQSDVADAPLLGTQISMMVFPLIPPDVKEDLPNLPQIQFVHPHNLGKFNFTIQKSPAGFNVTVTPILGNPIESSLPLEATLLRDPEPSVASDHVADASIFPIESSSADIQDSTSFTLETLAPGLAIEDHESMPKIETGAVPAVDIISVNDPQFQTLFSDTSTYEPPARRQDLGSSARR